MWLTIATDRSASVTFLLSLRQRLAHMWWRHNVPVSDTLLCTPVTSYMDRTPVSTGQEIRLTLWNPKVHHRAHKIPPFVPTMRQVNPVHGLPSYFFNIHCNIILSSTLRSSKRFLALSSNHSVACNLPSLSHDASPAHCVSYALSPYWDLALTYTLTSHWPHTDPVLTPHWSPHWPPHWSPQWPHTDPHWSHTDPPLIAHWHPHWSHSDPTLTPPMIAHWPPTLTPHWSHTDPHTDSTLTPLWSPHLINTGCHGPVWLSLLM